MSKRVCHCSQRAVFLLHWLNTWLLWSASAQPCMGVLHQNKFVFDSRVGNMLRGTTQTLRGTPISPYLRFPQISMQLLSASAHCPGCNHLGTVEHRPSTKTGRDAGSISLQQQFQHINKICNNCFTSNSSLLMHPNFIRLKFWLKQRETRQCHKHCVPDWLDRQQAGTIQ